MDLDTKQFKNCPYDTLSKVHFREELKISKKKSDEILDEMVKQGYFSKTDDKDELQFLIKGNAIRNAKFVKPITKKVAQKYGYKLVDHKLELYGVKVKSKDE